MADSYKTLTDLTTINQAGLADIEVTNIFDDAPLLKALAAGPSSDGTVHKYTRETGAPVVGFRAPNAGRENSKSTDEVVTINLKILDGSFGVDKALADKFKKGKEAYIAKEAKRHLRAMFGAGEKEILNGTLSGVSGAAADGFLGLRDALNSLSNEMVLSAGGDTDDGCGSIYMIRTNDDGADCTIIGADKAGDDLIDIEISPSVTQRLTDGTGKHYTGYWTPIMAWLALQIGSKFSVLRICNIDDPDLVTDDLLFDAFGRFPEERGPNLLVMPGALREGLRKSRKATNTQGLPVSILKMWEECKLIATRSLTMTEDPVA